ncbi:gliding motility-associated C-terminal domain-containing protein [Maribacter sp. 2307ULW6-5]|uniref:gliding motility-associated C-terminal domain-containing protein n=1 Tax=Maribacter sp. 2307ULW6-5 TaxID=3386275 RepID=UPI0039BD737A
MTSMLKNLVFLCISVLATALATGQDAVHNHGNMQVHGGGAIGFHLDVINNGPFKNDQGLVGFYGANDPLTLSGTSNPVVHDLEVAVDNGFFVNNTIGVLNNANFIVGDIITQRSAPDVNINFLNNSFYNGEGDATKVDGYTAISNKLDFVFPVGENQMLRPLGVRSTAVNNYARAAYFYENPNVPSTFSPGFDTDMTSGDSLLVSQREFWHLDSEVPSQVTLGWNALSNTESFATSIDDIVVVGWNVLARTWQNLGNASVTGDMTEGSVTSTVFVPDNFAILTLGGARGGLETLDNLEFYNYYVTPNGDGVNDTLTLEGLENSPNNLLQIYDRYGLLVYQKENYDNSFGGISNVNGVIARENGLPSGIYFYLVTLPDLEKKHQGYFYLIPREKN